MNYALKIFSVAALSLAVSYPAVAQNQPGLEKALEYRNFPATEYDSPFCYANTDSPKTFDLTRLCGGIASPASFNGGGTSGGGSNYGASTGSGKCNYSSDTASDGSRCGGRAASRKRGGK